MSGLKISNLFGRKLKETKDSLLVPDNKIITPYGEFITPEKFLTSPPWLTVVLSQIGVTEIVGPSGSNPVVEEYLAVVGMPSDDDIAWCSALANWSFKTVGIKTNCKPNAQSFLRDSHFMFINEPVLGCVVVFKRGNEPWMGHVAFYLDVNKANIVCVGGNQSNRVGVNSYAASKKMGYLWPKVAAKYLE